MSVSANSPEARETHHPNLTMPESAKRYTGRVKPLPPPGEATRANSSSRGYNARWQRARAIYLREFPLCQECEKHGHTTEATTVDHIVPHKGNQELFWNRENWQALCGPCHNRKTGKGQ